MNLCDKSSEGIKKIRSRWTTATESQTSTQHSEEWGTVDHSALPIENQSRSTGSTSTTQKGPLTRDAHKYFNSIKVGNKIKKCAVLVIFLYNMNQGILHAKKAGMPPRNFWREKWSSEAVAVGKNVEEGDAPTQWTVGRAHCSDIQMGCVCHSTILCRWEQWAQEALQVVRR